MKWSAGLCAVLGGTALALGVHADPQALADLTRAREELVERARDYRASLERLLVLQEDTVRRAANAARQRRELLAGGIVSRREVEESERAHADARTRVEDTYRRLGEAGMVMAEARAAIELASLPPPVVDEVLTTPTLIRYGGKTVLVLDELGPLRAFFASRFGRPLPVSALGQTPVHDRLGFDHRHAVDLAVHPDSAEGRALMAFLRERHTPFLAFRDAVPGASTGAHLHVGSASDRFLPVGAARH